jgi:hypothetical protein
VPYFLFIGNKKSKFVKTFCYETTILTTALNYRGHLFGLHTPAHQGADYIGTEQPQLASEPSGIANNTQ